MPETIIQLTPNAMQHITKSITDQNAAGFRLSVKKTGCSGYAYVSDVVMAGKPDDIHTLCDTISVYVDKNSVPYLQGTVIDFVDSGLGQTKLIFHNPNAANLCGCGESFNLIDES